MNAPRWACLDEPKQLPLNMDSTNTPHLRLTLPNQIQREFHDPQNNPSIGYFAGCFGNFHVLINQSKFRLRLQSSSSDYKPSTYRIWMT